MKFTWKNFPENPLSHAPKLQNLKKVWKNFPGYPLSHTPLFGKVFRDLPIWVKHCSKIGLYIIEFDSAACPEDLPYKCVLHGDLYCSVNPKVVAGSSCSYPRMSCTRSMTQNCDNYGSFCNAHKSSMTKIVA